MSVLEGRRTFGQLVGEFRAKSDPFISQVQLAKALGIHPPELLLVEAHRVTPQLKDVVTVMLSATKPPTKAEYEQVVKKIQGFLTHKKAINTHK